MAEPSIQPDGPINTDPPGRLSNEDYSAIIDAFATAIYEATGELRPPTAEKLARATGDLLEAVANRGTRMVTGAFGPILAHLEHLEHGQASLEQRFDRRQASNADIMTALREIQREIADHGRQIADHGQRIQVLERAVNDASAKR